MTNISLDITDRLQMPRLTTYNPVIVVLILKKKTLHWWVLGTALQNVFGSKLTRTSLEFIVPFQWLDPSCTFLLHINYILLHGQLSFFGTPLTLE